MWALAGEFLLLGGFNVLIGGVIIADEGLSIGVLLLAVGLVMVWWGAGFAGVPRSGLRVHQGGVTVREPLRRPREWTWSEVDCFELKRPAMKAALRVHLADGKEVSAFGLESWRRARYGHLAQAWVDELNHRVAAASDPSSYA
jgi:hypothetical protein